jgi:rubredoxin
MSYGRKPVTAKTYASRRAAFQCENCEKLFTEDECNPVKDIPQRFQRGDTYTDLECPDCGALCYYAGEERF